MCGDRQTNPSTIIGNFSKLSSTFYSVDVVDTVLVRTEEEDIVVEEGLLTVAHGPPMVLLKLLHLNSPSEVPIPHGPALSCIVSIRVHVWDIICAYTLT